MALHKSSLVKRRFNKTVEFMKEEDFKKQSQRGTLFRERTMRTKTHTLKKTNKQKNLLLHTQKKSSLKRL